MTTRGARLIVVGVALIAAFAAGRASAATPAPPVHVTSWAPVNVGPYAPVRVQSPRGSALPVTEPTPAPVRTTAGASVRGHKVSGVPTWFCRAGVSRCTHGYPDGTGLDLYAAAGPTLRVGHWRGRVVTVCAVRCIRVRLIDACACDRAMGHFLDLYHDAWVALGRPRKATVTW